VISTRADLIEAMSDYCGDVDMTKDRKTIGVVGYGYVGEAVTKGLAPVVDVLVYDKEKGWLEIRDGKPKAAWAAFEGIGREKQEEAHVYLVEHCSIIFVCVPTPMRQDGSCSTEIVEEVVRGLLEVMEEKGKSVLLVSLGPEFELKTKEEKPK